jgi:arginine/lysine/ornithine decarboxylase
MNPDFPVLLVETPSRRGPAEAGLEELRAALGRADVSTQMRPAGDDMTAFAQQSNRVSAFIYAVACDPADPSADDRALAALTRFVAAVRGRNPAVPIYLFGERLSAVALPPPVLKEIHGFVNAFEDSADFVARGIARTAQDYLDALAPPFFKALTDYARRGAYSWHAPGHSGGTAFLKSPVGTMFHEFFGENMLRADVCNAVEELGQLLDHTGPVADAERNAARIFSADHMYFVTNGTSTSNKIVWSAMVSPGDIVVVDRNCHKSVLHALILTGAIPIFLTPTRNQIGIIGPIPRREFDPASIRAKIEASPFVRDKTATPRLLTLTQSTYDGIVYNVEAIKASLDGYVGTLHFDEAWLPHAAFHDFYHQMHAIGPGRPPCATSLIVATQSTHKLLAGLSQASQILVQDSDRRDWDLHQADGWHGFSDVEPGFTMLDPIKATILTPGLDVAGTFGETGIPAAVLTRYLAEHGIVVEKTGLYSFFILFTIGITKGRWNTLISQLQRFKDAYDANVPVQQVMPRFAAAYPGYDGTGLRDLCQGIHDFYRAHDLARLTTDMYTSELVPQMLPADAWAQLTRGHVDRVPVDELKDRTTAVLLTPYPPGIPLLIPGERFNEAIVSYLRFAEGFNQVYPGLETIIHGAETRTAGDRSRLYVNCLREES